MPVGSSFACFTDADWVQLGIDTAVALGTLAAVIVAVVESARAASRAKKADRIAADAQAEANARAEVQSRFAASTADANRMQLESDIAIREHWLGVARSYGDALRIQELEAELARLRVQLEHAS